ncbi:MAG: peptidylprolyl isomerase, partial [bacterium]|nr:peptidylprolyl isomerase [bacterium]
EEYYGMPLAKLKRQFRTMVEEGMLIEKVRQDKMKDVKATPNDVQRFWDAYQDSIPELKDAIRIAHILLADSLSQVSIDAAVAKADSVRHLILSDQVTFEDYATRSSDDPGTAAKGGALGTTNRGDLVPEYEAAAYTMEPGDISPPVVSPFGVHVIRLNERIGEKVNTSHILFKIAPTAHDMDATKTRADSIIGAARAGADFADLSQQYSTDVKTAGIGGDLGWFTPADLPDDFRDPVANLKKGELAAPVRTVFGVHVLKVTDRVFARKVTFAEDYERIKRMALAKKQDEIFKTWVAELEKETYIERK